MNAHATQEPTTQLARREQRERAIDRAALSLCVPGLGQAAQRRYADAALQFGTVAAYVIGVFSLGGGRSMLLALLWNAWSVVDAFRHEAD
ncbi:MAG: hypothetical protein WC700_02530 [Gemmatimonadaceae bacterium]|jgi:hypothetical protein